jgi:hypothetical protein
VCVADIDGLERRGATDGRHPRCAQCALPFNRWRRGRRYHHPCGKICQSCYNQNRRSIRPVRTVSTPVQQSPLSRAQQSTLVATLEQAGIGQQGRTRSVPDNARALLLVHTLQEAAAVSYDKAVKIAAQVEQTSPRILRSASKRFARKNHLLRSASNYHVHWCSRKSMWMTSLLQTITTA